MSATNSVFSVFSFITFILVIIPFPWHLQAWNTGTLMYMSWTSVTLLALFINSVIWNDNAINWAPVWCDITSKLIIGVSVAIPAASMCINRRLYYIASVRSVTQTYNDKRRAMIVDLAIGIVIPVLVMILHYVVQGHRFDIFEEIGCYPFTYNTWPAYPILYAPPLILGVMSGVFCVLSIQQFRKRRQEFKDILSLNSNLNSNRYFCLMALATTDAVVNVPLSAVIIVTGTIRQGKLNPYNWFDVHDGFSRVDQIPAVYWKSELWGRSMIEATRWNVVVCGLLFFVFFGFGDEAKKHYKSAYTSITKKLGASSIGSSKAGGSASQGQATIGSFGNMVRGLTSLNISGPLEASRNNTPIYISREVIEKRDSLHSFRSELTEIKDFSDYAPSDRGISPYPSGPEERLAAGLMPTRERKASVPFSVTASESFLEVEDSKFNDNRV